MSTEHLNERIELLKESMRTIPDWPRPGVNFKDIQSILLDPVLTKMACDCLVEILPQNESGAFDFDSILAFDSRGFIFGFYLAKVAGVPLILARKKGKLPGQTIRQEYHTEYSIDTIEVQVGAIKPGSKILVHDDLLATGGTSGAAKEIITKCGAEIAGYHYLMELEFLPGRKNLSKHTSSGKIHSLIKY
jgi:adenine phosphoribosyltransferase